jgi:membrane protease YdiL (CAAX protease family)
MQVFSDSTAEATQPSSTLARSTVVGLAAAAAQLCWIGAVMRSRRITGRPIGVSPESAPAPLGQSLALMLASTILAWPALLAAAFITNYLQQQWSGPTPELGHQMLEQMVAAGTQDVWWWVAAFAAVVIAPCVEETVNRGFIQQGLKAARISRPTAVVVTAAVFALLHWSAIPEGARLPGLVTLALLGLLWGWLYERTGRLSVCIVAHALFNVVNLMSLPQG